MTILVLLLVPAVFFALGYRGVAGRTLWARLGMLAVLAAIGASCVLPIGWLLPVLAAMPFVQGAAVAWVVKRIRAHAN